MTIIQETLITSIKGDQMEPPFPKSIRVLAHNITSMFVERNDAEFNKRRGEVEKTIHKHLEGYVNIKDQKANK